MTEEFAFLISMLSLAVAGQKTTVYVPADWTSVLKCARKHGIEALVYEGIQKTSGLWESIPGEVQGVLMQAYMQATCRDMQQEYIKQQLDQKLTEACVPHVFLKGAVLKYDYPIPALRTMSDLDILVYTKDLGKINKVALQLKGIAEIGDGNHKNFVFPGRVTVEFHPNLLHHATPIGTQINPGWQYVKDTPNVFCKELTEEGFYLHTICHIAEHFVSGGVGVRFVLDVWVCRHLRKKPINRAFVETELTRFGLLDFAQKLEQLADAWFGEGVMTPVLEELGEYILTSGSYGTSERAMLNSISFTSNGSRFSALMKKAFYPKAELEDRFPWCKGKPYLLPAAWCTRAFRAITKHGDMIIKWSKGTGAIDKNYVVNNQEKLRRFGVLKNDK